MNSNKHYLILSYLSALSWVFKNTGKKLIDRDGSSLLLVMSGALYIYIHICFAKIMMNFLPSFSFFNFLTEGRAWFKF